MIYKGRGCKEDEKQLIAMLDDVFFKNGEMPQFILDDLEKIPFGKEQIVK